MSAFKSLHQVQHHHSIITLRENEFGACGCHVSDRQTDRQTDRHSEG